MVLTFTLAWWMIPLAVAVIGTLFMPTGSGGFVVGLLCWFAAICIVLGRYVGLWFG